MASVIILVTDMGNGGAYCDKCNYCLDGGNPAKTVPNNCPQCGESFTATMEPYINKGGSDF